MAVDLSADDLLELHRRMVLLRTYDERAVVYHRQGRLGTYAISWNHEAIQAGATFALRDDDWIFPSYREGSIGLVRGMSPAVLLQWWRGHPAGWWNPAEWKIASICVPIATHVPHAAGLAWGKKLRGEDTVAMAFFGDGATSEGAFHEGVNFAAVMGAPAVFVCNNNGLAISTPVEAQTRADSLADKAVGYGIPGVRVDGLDVLAVHEAAREAVERARAGGGPTLIEAVHYRVGPHGTADDPSAYVDTGRLEAARAGECVGRFETYLKKLGVLDDERVAVVRAACEGLMRAGIAAAEEAPPPDPELLFANAYVDPPENMRRG
jgi:pyruvate dehydrogenase E1 component alpha subunit